MPSACLLRLTPTFALATPVLKLSGPGECGAEDVVQLSAVVTRAGHVAIAPPATLRCSMAEAVAHWVRDDLAPAAAELGSPLAAIANFAAYECRGRNRIVGAKISEHGKANALDVRALKLANGKTFELTDISGREGTAGKGEGAAACARFTTVLGPASDGFHENHIHVDLAERRTGFACANGPCASPGTTFRCRASGRRKRRRARKPWRGSKSFTIRMIEQRPPTKRIAHGPARD